MPLASGPPHSGRKRVHWESAPIAQTLPTSPPRYTTARRLVRGGVSPQSRAIGKNHRSSRTVSEVKVSWSISELLFLVDWLDKLTVGYSMLFFQVLSISHQTFNT